MFLFHYFKNPKQTGAFCASSKKLSKLITSHVHNAKNIVEIGPGTGSFTQYILKQKSHKANFFAVEINPHMAKKLKKNIKNIDVEVNSAEFLSNMLEKRSIKQLDLIISGIPWAMLNSKEQDVLLNSIHEVLEEKGCFATFAYVLPTPKGRAFKKKLFATFSKVEISPIIWQNLPPAFVYFCTK
ncbi:class I SAM-dependent methyltransferase [Campylobacter peloridis]|uniref:Methyltransferase domain-containing protein n=1 Tax=Campylobacter peloridis TaxID=488546 RepID=A0ABX6TRM6_9BACT|nr:methyltransferase domain-containing protein [Campylobacter peloridis]AJC84448.1 SAM-dependent methyltransferase [Campylobacter peloridis LMG 23910]MBX1886022.1 methyltransferase domain-containing protein [Campylobacter peloridis]MBX2078646.1 methyltransferase domain-containing protein [Campylobacter peloridis]QOQ88541.1 methyltransferase domain-containing protein [Campylobacter peloridis]